MGKKTRIKACELAAQVMAGRPNELCVPQLWSLAVFFEQYIDLGHKTTKHSFGPKEPAKLKACK